MGKSGEPEILDRTGLSEKGTQHPQMFLQAGMNGQKQVCARFVVLLLGETHAFL